MTPFDRHLQAAACSLELDLPLEHREELEQIEPGMKASMVVLAVLAVCMLTYQLN